MCKPTFRSSLACSLAAILLASQVIACGTILYPERRGQAKGKIDADIVILDAVGLLFFFVPGVVAFAVDFATGTIYLPKGQSSRVLNMFGEAGGEKRERVAGVEDLKPEQVAAIETAISERTGLRVDLRSEGVRSFPLREGEELQTRLRQLNAELDRG